MVTPKPPRDDDKTPPDRPRVTTPVRGVARARTAQAARELREIADRDVSPRRKRPTPAHILRALGRDPATPMFIEEEKTPIRLILAVREELKDDIEPLKALPEAVAKLTGEVTTTNKLLPVMLEAIRDELAARRAEDHVIVTTKMDVARHREITNINSEAADKATKRKVRLKIAGLLTSVSLATTAITLLAARC